MTLKEGIDNIRDKLELAKREFPNEAAVSQCIRSDIYARCVKHLMQTTYRTAKELDDWRCRGFYKKNMPERFGRLMRLVPEKSQQIIDEVRKEHNRATREDNKDA